MYRRAILVSITVLISLSTLFGLFPQTVYADTPAPYLAPAVVDAATKSTERNSLGMCLAHDNTSHGGAAIKDSNYGYDINPQNIANGAWFSDWTQIRQWSDYNKNGDGTNCDKFDVNKAIADLGWTSKMQAGCDLGMKRQNGSNCVSGTGNLEWDGGANKQDVLNRIDKVYQGTALGKEYTPEQYYVMAISVLTNDKTCKASALASVATANPDQKNQADATITVVGSDGTPTQVYYKFNGDKGETWSFRNGIGNDQGYDNYGKDCAGMAQIANDNANAYAKWVQQNPQGSANNAGTCDQYATLQVNALGGQSKNQDYYNKLVAACQAGQTNKSDAGFCNKTYPPVTAGPPEARGPTAENAACVYGRDKATDSTNPTPPNSADNKPTCGIEGIGWLVCPVMNFMAKVNDAAYNFLASYFLTVDTKLVTESEPAWAKFRDIANVAFVIAILFVVYSQISSVGISNYGIKRMLPRIIVAALLVNVSFYICAAAVDLSNLLGYAIPQFFGNIPIGAGLQDSGGLATLGSGLSWVLVIGGVVAAAVGVALAVSVPVLLAALLAIGLIVLMLVGRQAFIVLLIVISPLAFVAYLLPNTEQWFKKWYKAFFALLMLFPVVGTVFGASKMAALIINNAGGGSEKVITQLIALAVSAVPFFVVPSLLKGSLAAAGTLGAKLQGMANGAGKRVGARVKDSSYAGAYMAQRKKIKATDRAQSYGKGLKGRLSNSRATGRAGSHLASTGMALASKEESEAVDHEMVAMQKQSGWTEANRLDKAQEEFVSAMKKGDTTKARAAQRILLSGGNKGISNLQSGYSELGQMQSSAYGSMMNSATGQKVMSDLSSSGIKGKNAALNQMSYTEPVDAQGNKNTVDSIANKASTYNSLNDTELAGQSEANLRTAVQNGGISQERAQRIQGNDTVWSQLSEDKKTIISSVAGAPATPANTTPSSSGSTTPQQGPASNPGGSTQLNIPHSGSTPPAASPPAGPPSGAAPHASSAHTPPGTSNYQQRPSGFWVPPGSGGGTPPSTP